MSKHERENAQLLGAIKHSHEASDGTYGSPRVVRDLIDAGFSCSENRVARLMKAAGIKARHKRRRAPGQLHSPVHAIAPNLLDMQFEATGPNQKGAADFTYVWTGEGWLFVAIVLERVRSDPGRCCSWLFVHGKVQFHPRETPRKMHDLSKYSLPQLRALEVQVIDELKTRHFLSISKAREQILHIARNAGLSEKQLRAIKVGNGPKIGDVEVKYRNPEDTSQEWSGRGRRPAWVKAWVASGKSLQDAKA